MIVLEDNCLEFRFPEVHAAARCGIEFQRTLRIPDDGRDYPLPPGLGCFPLRHLDDYAERLPESWRVRGGVLAPMHQAEALWINFHSDYPFAVKVATGKVCAITGEAWVDHLNRDPQDYAALPEQPWLDGYCVEEGVVRQFVAMPLGEGHTVEEQLTGAAGPRRVADCRLSHEGRALREAALKMGRISRRRHVLRRARRRCRHGSCTRWPDEAGDLRRPLRARRLGPAARQPLLCLAAQLRSMDGGDRRAPADPTAHSAGLHRQRPALVRLLWRGCASGGRQRKAAGAHERRPAGQGSGGNSRCRTTRRLRPRM